MGTGGVTDSPAGTARAQCGACAMLKSKEGWLSGAWATGVLGLKPTYHRVISRVPCPSGPPSPPIKPGQVGLAGWVGRVGKGPKESRGGAFLCRAHPLPGRDGLPKVPPPPVASLIDACSRWRLFYSSGLTQTGLCGPMAARAVPAALVCRSLIGWSTPSTGVPVPAVPAAVRHSWPA